MCSVSFIATVYDYAAIFEYDALCLKQKIDVSPGLHGIVQANSEPHIFYTPRYVNSPWIVDRESAMKMLVVAEKYPDLMEGGNDDRYLSALAWVAGVPVLGHHEPGLGRNTITISDWPLMEELIQKGAKWLHGVKTEDTLAIVKSLVPDLP